MNYFLKALSLKSEEVKLLVAILFIFALFCAYAILRPIRDVLGIQGE